MVLSDVYVAATFYEKHTPSSRMECQGVERESGTWCGMSLHAKEWNGHQGSELGWKVKGWRGNFWRRGAYDNGVSSGTRKRRAMQASSVLIAKGRRRKERGVSQDASRTKRSRVLRWSVSGVSLARTPEPRLDVLLPRSVVQ
jgi:hypothetical protein